MILDDWQFNLLNTSDDVKSVSHVYWFVKKQQNMNAFNFREVLNKIRDLCASQEVNWAILMMAHGTYVFTDKTLNVDPVMLKLSDNLNFEGEITDGKSLINQVNSHLRGRTE